MSQHVASIVYKRSFDIVSRQGGVFDVTTTEPSGGQSHYSGLTLDEVVDYYKSWARGKKWVRP